MSNHVSSEVYKRQLGSMARKAVMTLFADKASDNGTGIWAAKQTMADELDTSKQTVIATIKALVADGLVIEVGHRKCQNGYLVEYAIDMQVLRRLPLVKAHRSDQSNSLTGKAASPVKRLNPTGQAALPDQSSSLTQTPIEPSLNHSPPTPRAGVKRERAAISVDWIVPVVGDLPQPIRALATQWPAGAYRAEGEAFHQHWRGRGQRRSDWDALWAARVQARHVEVMRAAKAGVRFDDAAGNAVAMQPVPTGAKRREDDRSNALHQALRDALGDQVCDQWFSPAALVFEDCGLIVVAPSQFHRTQLENHHQAAIDVALSAIGTGVDWTRFMVEAPRKSTPASKNRSLRRE